LKDLWQQAISKQQSAISRSCAAPRSFQGAATLTGQQKRENKAEIEPD
jgi:hypothetical protein